MNVLKVLRVAACVLKRRTVNLLIPMMNLVLIVIDLLLNQENGFRALCDRRLTVANRNASEFPVVVWARPDQRVARRGVDD